MGINNIEVLINPELTINQTQRMQEALIQQRVAEHRAGLHTYGSMRRDCPLCQAYK